MKRYIPITSNNPRKPFSIRKNLKLCPDNSFVFFSKKRVPLPGIDSRDLIYFLKKRFTSLEFLSFRDDSVDANLPEMDALNVGFSFIRL